MFGPFKPAPYLEELKDPVEIKRRYRYWQYRTLIGMYLGYLVYYFTRKNLPFAMPGLMEDLGYTKVSIGWVLTLSSLAYGVSKFSSGIFSDQSNPRYFMAFGLFITGVLNILFGLSSSIWLLALLWGLNGWFQGFGWPPCSRLLTHWYGRRERGRWWAVWNTSHNIGAFLIPLIAVRCISYFGDWRFAMYIPGCIAIGMSFIVMNRLRDTPQSLALPSIERYRGDSEGTDQQGRSIERELTTREILFRYVLTNKFIWLLAFAYFFVYLVRQAVSDWGMVFLIEAKGFTATSAADCIAWLEIGGLFGSLASGFISDVIFRGNRGPVNALFALAVVLCLGLFWFIPSGMWLASAAAIFMIGFFIFGPQMLIGIACAELSHKKAAATSSGFAGFFAYLGAAVAGGPIASIAQHVGWGAFFLTVGISGVVALVLLIPTWRLSVRTPLTAASVEDDAAEVA